MALEVLESEKYSAWDCFKCEIYTPEEIAFIERLVSSEVRIINKQGGRKRNAARASLMTITRYGGII